MAGGTLHRLGFTKHTIKQCKPHVLYLDKSSHFVCKYSFVKKKNSKNQDETNIDVTIRYTYITYSTSLVL